MLIDGFSPIQGISALSETEQRRRQRKAPSPSGASSGGDTVSFSQEALDLAAKMLERQTQAVSQALREGKDGQTENLLTSARTADASVASSKNDDAEALGKKFRSYLREYGVGGAENSGDADKSAASRGGVESSDDTQESTADQIAKLEKRIKDLMEELVDVLSGDLPEVAKQSRATQLQKEIEDLMSQLTALKRGEKDEQAVAMAERQEQPQSRTGTRSRKG
ncbi:MAG: FlxA-like family protein [Desulfovibrionaceae bacterium]|nr:FlxA-like family protein [Desulfovibrionaceae bacterium]